MYNSYQRNAPAPVAKVAIEPPISARPLPNQRDVPEYMTPTARQLRAIHPSTASRLHDSKGHTRSVKTMAWSCNGQVLATAGDDRNVRLWDYKRPGETSGTSYRSSADPFSQPTPEPLTESSRSPSLPSSLIPNSKDPTTADSPIILIAFAPRDPDILAVASSGLVGGENHLMMGLHPGDEEEVKEFEKEKGKWVEVGKAVASGSTTDRRGDSSAEDRKFRMDGPKVTIWNIRRRQILVIIPLPPCTPVALTFHPASLQIAIVFMQSGLGQDTAWFAFRPHSVVDPSSDLLLEDPAGGRAEQIKREKEKAWIKEGGALGSTETDANMDGSGDTPDDRWQIRKDIRLGEKGYKVDTGEKVPEFNGAMFSPCGTRFYAGNHDGALYAWEYPIRPVGANEVEQADGEPSLTNGDSAKKISAKESTEDGGAKAIDENGASDATKTKPREDEAEEEERPEGEEEDDDTGRRRRKLEADVVEDEPTEEDAIAPIPIENALPEAVEVETGEAPTEPEKEAEVDGDVEMKDTQAIATTDEDAEMKVDSTASAVAELNKPVGPADNEDPVETAKTAGEEQSTEPLDAAKPAKPGAAEARSIEISKEAAEDIEMEPVETEEADETTSEATKTDAVLKSTTASNEAPPSNGDSATVAPEPVKKASQEVVKKLEYLFRQSMHVGCLNCIDIDPKRRYIATGGSEGLVNLSDHRNWISVKTFDSYTEEVKHLKFSWDGEYLAAAGQDRCIDIMATATGTTVHRIQTRTNVQCLAWSPARHVLCFALENHASGAAGQAGDWFYVTL